MNKQEEALEEVAQYANLGRAILQVVKESRMIRVRRRRTVRKTRRAKKSVVTKSTSAGTSKRGLGRSPFAGVPDATQT